MFIYNDTVQYEDIDYYGIIHHPKILYYMERARVNFFLSNQIQITDLSLGIIIRKIEVKYKRQLLMHDKITIELTSNDIETYKFNFLYKIKVNNKEAVEALSEMVIIDLNTKKIVKIPEHIRSLLEKIKING